MSATFRDIECTLLSWNSDLDVPELADYIPRRFPLTESARVTAHPEVILLVQTVRPSAVFRPRGLSISPTSGLCIERRLKALGINPWLAAPMSFSVPSRRKRG